MKTYFVTAIIEKSLVTVWVKGINIQNACDKAAPIIEMEYKHLIKNTYEIINCILGDTVNKN